MAMRPLCSTGSNVTKWVHGVAWMLQLAWPSGQRGVAWQAGQGSETSVAWRGGVVYGAANTRGLGTDVSVVVGLPGRACPCRVEVDGAQCPCSLPRRAPPPRQGGGSASRPPGSRVQDERCEHLATASSTSADEGSSRMRLRRRYLISKDF